MKLENREDVKLCPGLKDLQNKSAECHQQQNC